MPFCRGVVSRNPTLAHTFPAIGAGAQALVLNSPDDLSRQKRGQNCSVENARQHSSASWLYGAGAVSNAGQRCGAEVWTRSTAALLALSQPADLAAGRRERLLSKS